MNCFMAKNLWHNPFLIFYGDIYLIYRKGRAYMCYMGFDTQKNNGEGDFK